MPGLFDSLVNSFKSPSASTAASPGSDQENGLDSPDLNAEGGTIPNKTAKAPIAPPKSPNDILDDIFKPEEPKLDSTGKPIKAEAPKPLIELDNKTIFENANKIDFSAAFTDEEAQAALGGDAKALRSLINKAGAMGSAVSMKQSAAMIEDAVERRLSTYNDTVKSTVKSSNVEAVIFSDSRFNSPSVRPMVESIVQRIMSKDSTATPEKIKAALPQLISAMAQRMQPEGTEKKKEGAATNFDDFFDDK